MDYATLLQLLDSTLRLATPLLLACLAGLYSERSGVFDIGLEGKMLVAAMCAGAVAFYTGSAWLGLLAGIAGSLVFALIHGITSITFRGNQLIAGVALNFLASGLTVLTAQALFGQGGRTPPLEGAARFDPVALPAAETLAEWAETSWFGTILVPILRPVIAVLDSIDAGLRAIPVLGRLYSEVLTGHSELVYAAFASVALTWWVLYRTRYGLRLRAVGENPAAVDTAGVSVIGLRFSAVMITGVLCGLAGAYMSTALQAGFGKEMTAGRGYIALAALIFAKWRPVAAMWACLLFGFFQAVALRPDVVTYQNIAWILWFATFAILIYLFRAEKLLATVTVTGALLVAALLAMIQRIAGALGPNLFEVKIPVPFLDALPYILTVIVLAGFIGKAIPPRAGGEPYVKER